MFRSLASFVIPGRFPPSPSQSESKLMHSIVMRKHGDAEVLLYEEFPCPVPNKRNNQVLVKVIAAGLNPLDFKMRKGPIADFIYPKPKIIGSDISGIVAEVFPGSRLQVGQKVIAMLPLLGTQYGGYAEFCAVDESLLAVVPDDLSLVDLAGLPLVACTVLQALRAVVYAYDGGTAGKRCLVTCGSGGLGHIAVQYCANVLGMEVTTTCSARNIEWLKSLGAKEAIDYKTQSIEDNCTNFDVFFDSRGYENEEKVFRSGSTILKPSESHYICIASSPYGEGKHGLSEDPLGLSIPEARLDRMIGGFMKAVFGRVSSIKYHYVLVHPERSAVEQMCEAIQTRKVKLCVDKYFPLAEAAQAHRMLEEGHVSGKLILKVSDV